MDSHKRKAVGFLFTIFSITVLLISALTSFSFFYIYFGTLIPDGLVDSFISRIVSGFVGMLLFDVAAAIWLLTFLHHSETSEQRGISISMTMITFLGAASASVAYLSLSASGEMALGAATKETIAIIALIVVIAGVILNFGAAQAHQRFSIASKEAVREADRRDIIQAAEQQQAQYLDGLIAKNMKEKLTELAPQLAEKMAGSLASKFYDVENQKYEEPMGSQKLIGSFAQQPEKDQVTIHYGTTVEEHSNLLEKNRKRPLKK